MSQFQVKFLNKDYWREKSERTDFGKLVDEFDRVTPIIAQMIQGKEIITTAGIFRMKEIGQKEKGFLLIFKFDHIQTAISLF
jgi:hypothetical protein